MEALAVANEKIRALKHRFIQGLPARISAIHDALARSGDGRAASDLERGFHSLAGTAATYGLSSVAALAAEGEEICGGTEFDAEALQFLHSIVDELRAAVPSDDSSD